MRWYNKLIKIGFWYSVYEPTLPRPEVCKETYISLVDKEKVISILKMVEILNFKKVGQLVESVDAKMVLMKRLTKNMSGQVVCLIM